MRIFVPKLAWSIEVGNAVIVGTSFYPIET